MVAGNPLSYDPALYNMYATVLDAVLEDPEISGLLEELEFSSARVRMAMTAAAGEILRDAVEEFAVYTEERMRPSPERPARDAGRARPSVAAQTLPGVLGSFETAAVLTSLGYWLAAIGLGAGVAGLASVSIWPWTQWLLWAGATLVVSGVMACGFGWLSGQEWFRTMQGAPSPGNPALARARDDLMAAVQHEDLVARARTLIGTWREARFSHLFGVTGISGLSEIHEDTYQVATSTAVALEDLLERLDGASIGVAGPRGAGKSSLIRSYCESSGRDVGGDLRCLVSAPVKYEPQEFVLHLFDVFCRAVIDHCEATARLRLVPAMWSLLYAAEDVMRSLPRVAVVIAGVAGLLHWQKPVADVVRVSPAWVFGTAVTLAGLGLVFVWRATFRLSRKQPPDRVGRVLRLAAEAARHLDRISYLRTYTAGWSGALGLSRGLSGQFSRSLARAERILTYPDVVRNFRTFAKKAAAHLNQDGDKVFIGIDELDKIGGADQAEMFLNAIKGIFGIPHVYFMVSVSDDALAAFDRRGLPLRDTFDSSFDEIIRVGTLTYSESRRLLSRRVTGLTEPYVALCHCLAGGLARDIIRAGRQVVHASETIAGAAGTVKAARAADDPAILKSTTAFVLLQEARGYQRPSLGAICREVVREELERKSQAVAQAASSVGGGQSQALLDCLHNAARSIDRGVHGLKIVDLVARSAVGEPEQVARLRGDFAAYAYYCATIQDVFCDTLDAEQMVRATSNAGEPGTFDELAAARHDFALGTQHAWQAISQFREVWGLDVLPWNGS